MFLIFGGECYYASGGGYDYLGKTESLGRAKDVARLLVGRTAIVEICDIDDDFNIDHEIEWAHVFSVERGEVVATYGDSPFGGKPTLEVRP